MHFIAAIVAAAVLAAGVSCDSPHFSRDVDFLDVESLSDGVLTTGNVEWFKKNSENPHGLDCGATCRGFGSGEECKGLHTTTCSGVHAGKRATVHSKMVVTCLGSYSFEQNRTDDQLDMSTKCHGLFASHTFTAISKSVTMLPENCHGHCSHHHKGSHCSEHCPMKSHHGKIDALVKSEAACGLGHTWSLSHPLTKGSTVSTHSTCSGVSSFSMLFYGEKDVFAVEEMEAMFLEEATAYDSADSNTILDKLSSVAAMSTSPMKESELIDDTVPSVLSAHGGDDDESMTVLCNGKPADLQDECDGKEEVYREGKDKHGGTFKEHDICQGKHAFTHKTYVCQGTLSSDRTDISAEGEEKVVGSVCEGKHLFSMLAKDGDGASVSGFGTVCVGDGTYDTATTPAAEPAPKPAPGPTPAPEAESIDKPEVSPAAESPTAAPTQDSPMKALRKSVDVSFFKDERVAIV